ncbi:MAG: esterase family protein [Clostridiales bacterium]|nr:esterase family protein [Clostridiales bacterium]
MAFFNGSIRSSALEMWTGLAVSLPFDISDADRATAPVVYLLHGQSDDHTGWFRGTSADRYAADRGMALVIPEVQRSYYADMAYGLAYRTYITKELPKLVERLFGLTPARERTFVAGLSMGGHGALKCALGRPEQYAACAAFSSVTDAAGRADWMPAGQVTSVWGDEVKPEEDIFQLAQSCAALPPSQRPRVYMSCGLEDGLLDHSERFHRHLESLGIEHTYETWPGGHEWGFWDQCLPKALDFFLNRQA